MNALKTAIKELEAISLYLKIANEPTAKRAIDQVIANLMAAYHEVID